MCKWFDLWIGVFVDVPRRRVYFLPIPCVGIMIEWGCGRDQSSVAS